MSGGDDPAIPGRAGEPVVLPEPRSLWELPTPALVVDLDALESNLDRMAAHYAGRTAGLRPHTKTHKCPVLARAQLVRGAVGVCAATVREAEVMVDAGIGDVLITSPVVTRDKICRVVDLAARSPGVAQIVDRQQNVLDLHDAARERGIRLDVLIDLNLGSDRTGVNSGEEAMGLATAIGRCPSLRLRGLQAYAAHIQHQVGWHERRQSSSAAMERAAGIRCDLERAGFDVPLLTGGGTGTWDIDCEVDGVSDVQAGSYLFMDAGYRAVGGPEGPVFDGFRPALFVLATAISQPRRGQITIDAGAKACARDNHPPELRDTSGVNYRWAGDEHGVLHFEDPGSGIEVGARVLLIPSHCDPTVNLYDHYHPFRDEEVTELWPIAARGGTA